MVRSEHLNHQNHLFGGHMMAEIDTIAYCLLQSCYGELRFVTRAAEFSFNKPAHLGDLVTFCAKRTKKGRTSIQVHVCGCVAKNTICSATMTFVCVDATGDASIIPDESEKTLRPKCHCGL